MTAEPLRSAMSIGNSEDTSLALPSDNKLRSGQQRVLDQVHTIKRSKSKQGRNGTLSLSPTSPTPNTVFESFKFSPSKTNGTFSRTNGSATLYKMAGAQKARTLSAKSTGQRHVSTSQWDQRFETSTWPQPPNGLQPSRSDPSLTIPLSPAPAPAPPLAMRARGSSQQTNLNRTSRQSTYSMSNGNAQLVSSQTRMGRPPSTQSHHESKMSVAKANKTEQSTVDGTFRSDMTLKEAVALLTHPEENFQQYGASFIQHSTFKEERPKQEVLRLGGIPPLVALLQSPNPAVSQTAAAALRNLVFKDQANKQEVQQCEGIAKALQLLKQTDSTETQKHVTGLLWNMSSDDNLKGELIATAMPVLTECVVVPITGWSESTVNNNIHPDVFYNATGCLRNLSCVQQNQRKAMRDCNGLIDSLMTYIQSCVVEDNPDDQSVENCACILHNLTYNLEKESPECFAKYNRHLQDISGGKKSSTVGCFSPKSSKIDKENVFAKCLPDDSTPSGVQWLCHRKAMMAYLSLLGSSKKDATLEACCGALQNLTANKGPGSNVMSHILAQEMGAVTYISPLLKSSNRGLQKTAMSLVCNLSRTATLQTPMARQILPELTKYLSAGTQEMGKCDDTIASACHTVHNLISADAEVSKNVITKELVTSLCDLSENSSFPKAHKAASVLLYNLWNDKSLQGTLKKLGMSKPLFVNDITTAAHKSMQVIE